MESQIQISSIFNTKYERIRLLAEGNYGKAILLEVSQIMYLNIIINNKLI